MIYIYNIHNNQIVVWEIEVRVIIQEILLLILYEHEQRSQILTCLVHFHVAAATGKLKLERSYYLCNVMVQCPPPPPTVT
jgi:hypothetical protein